MRSIFSVTRLELFKTQNELARNFYDDFEFCPVLCMDEVRLLLLLLLLLLSRERVANQLECRSLNIENESNNEDLLTLHLTLHHPIHQDVYPSLIQKMVFQFHFLAHLRPLQVVATNNNIIIGLLSQAIAAKSPH